MWAEKRDFWEFHVIDVSNSKKRCFNFDFYFYVCIQGSILFLVVNLTSDNLLFIS